jgi:hypothetical protein
MKKILIIIILFFQLTSCEKVDKLTDFSLELNSDLSIDADQALHTLIHLDQNEIILNDEAFENNDTSRDLLEEVKLKDVILSIDNLSGNNFNFLTDIDFFIEAEGLPKIRVAWKNNMPDENKTQISLETLNENMVDYFKKDKLYISADIITDEEILRNIQVGVILSFNVNGKSLGK